MARADQGQIAPLFQSMGRAIADMCTRYNTRELAAIRNFIVGFNQLTYEETRKLREGVGPTKPDKGSKPTAAR